MRHHLIAAPLLGAAGIAPALADGSPLSDAAFVKKAFVGDLFEQEAELALQRAINPRLKDFAQGMISQHGKAQKELRDAVGKAGVIFPAIAAATKASEAKMATDGIDVSAFVSEAKPGITFPFPVTDHVSEIQSTMKSTMDDIFLGRSKAAPALKQANESVNALFN